MSSGCLICMAVSLWSVGGVLMRCPVPGLSAGEGRFSRDTSVDGSKGHA